MRAASLFPSMKIESYGQSSVFPVYDGKIKIEIKASLLSLEEMLFLNYTEK